MPKKTNLTLNDINIQSFVTSLTHEEYLTIKSGGNLSTYSSTLEFHEFCTEFCRAESVDTYCVQSDNPDDCTI